MSHKQHEEDKKAQKKALLKKNRHNQEIFNAVRIHKEIGERIQEEADGRQAAVSAPTGDDKVWSEKVASVRNRLTGQKRLSKERWNRFAGTSGGGGRGL